MSKSPAQIVKEKFGEKNKLVEAVQQFASQDLWVGRENKDKGLARVSNAKLLRLLDIFTAVQSKFGSRAKLIDAVVEVAGRGKDAGYRTGIENWPVPRLFDFYKSLTKAAAPKEKKVARKVEAKKVVAKVEPKKAIVDPKKVAARKAAAKKK